MDKMGNGWYPGINAPARFITLWICYRIEINLYLVKWLEVAFYHVQSNAIPNDACLSNISLCLFLEPRKQKVKTQKDEKRKRKKEADSKRNIQAPQSALISFFFLRVVILFSNYTCFFPQFWYITRKCLPLSKNKSLKNALVLKYWHTKYEQMAYYFLKKE